MNLFKKTVRDINQLRIQGATNVAKSAVKALEFLAEKSKARTKADFLKELEKARQELCAKRLTEPLMRNALRYIHFNVKDSSVESVEDLKKLVSVVGEDILKNVDADKEKIAHFLANKVAEGNTVLTHCHSSTVTAGLIKAWKDGKKFSVICTETRPLFQGRRTAKELIEAGIPVTMIVDSAMSTFIEKTDFVVVGCDVITADINLINKVGTLYAALASKRTNRPFYVCTELAKFDPETLFGKNEQIEQRPADEIWKSRPDKLNIANPAFDVTPRELLTSFITQEGIIPPDSLFDMVKDKAPWILYGVKQ